MKIVYVAGPFSAPTRDGVVSNIAAATIAAMKLATIGLMPLCPHANTAHPEFERLQPYEFWLEGTLELLKRCDGMLMVKGWERSRGATDEREWALANGLPVFESAVDAGLYFETVEYDYAGEA